jgi:DDE superfamily endonuclease.
MDQTAMFFSMKPRTTIDEKGKRTVTVHDTKNGDSRITVAVSITADWQVLKPFLVMKGKHISIIPSFLFYQSLSNYSAINIGKSGRRIERSFNNFPVGGHYKVQDNAWMDERLMLVWVEEVLRPWAEEAPDGIVPFLLLNSYRCHMADAVKRLMDEIGVEYQYIPGGSTGLCQPVDVGINKPFKDRMIRKWEQFLMDDREEEVRGKIPSPSREVLSQWVIDSLNNMDAQLVKNAWNGPGFAYSLLTPLHAEYPSR